MSALAGRSPSLWQMSGSKRARQRVELAVEYLAAFGGGDAGAADEAHGVVRS